MSKILITCPADYIGQIFTCEIEVQNLPVVLAKRFSFGEILVILEIFSGAGETYNNGL
jgi:hypothetical protein